MSDAKLEYSSRLRFTDFLIIVVFLSIAAVFVYLLADDMIQTVNMRETFISDLPVIKAPLAVNIPPEAPQISSAPAAEKPPAEEPLAKELSIVEPASVPKVSPAPAVTPSRSQPRSSLFLAATVAPSSLLPSPRNMQPSRGADFSLVELRSGKNITFSWTAVQGANAYIFYLYRQTASGQPQTIRTNLVFAPSYTMSNSRVLNSGTFIWKIEAVYIGKGNVIERSGTQGDSTFTVNSN